MALSWERLPRARVHADGIPVARNALPQGGDGLRALNRRGLELVHLPLELDARLLLGGERAAGRGGLLLGPLELALVSCDDGAVLVEGFLELGQGRLALLHVGVDVEEQP